MKTKIIPQFRVLPVKWVKENPVELLVLARAQTRHADSRTISLLRALQSHPPVALDAPRRVAGGG